VFQQAGVSVRVGGQAAEHGFRVGQGFLGAFQGGHGGSGGVFGVAVGGHQALQHAGGGAQGVGGGVAAAVFRGELGQRRLDGFGAFFALLQAGARFGEVLFLAVLGGQRFQFGDGVAQEIFLAAGGGDGLAGGGEAFGGGAPGAVAGGEL